MSRLAWSDPAWTQPHWLYRHYDADEVLLYVGMTRRPDVRPHRHGERPWLAASVRVDLEGPMTRLQALTLEEEAIAAEEPVHNTYARNGAFMALLPEHEDMSEEWHARCDARALEVIGVALSGKAAPPRADAALALTAEDFVVPPPADVLDALRHHPWMGHRGCADCRPAKAVPA